MCVYYNRLNTSTIQNIAIATGIGKIKLGSSYLVNPEGLLLGALHLGQSPHQVGGSGGEVSLWVEAWISAADMCVYKQQVNVRSQTAIAQMLQDSGMELTLMVNTIIAHCDPA
jgi:hypothetical protein